MSNKIGNPNKIVGWWNGEPIWRPKTPEEKLLEEGIKPEVANLGFTLEVNHLKYDEHKHL